MGPDMNLNEIETQILIDFLEELSSRYSNDGCNDWSMEFNAETERTVANLVKHEYDICGDEDVVENVGEEGYSASNFTVVDYLIERLAGDRLSPEEIPNEDMDSFRTAVQAAQRQHGAEQAAAERSNKEYQLKKALETAEMLRKELEW